MVLAKLHTQTIKAATKPGRYGDGGGLYLIIDKPRVGETLGQKRWVFRFTLNGKVSETGLGGLNSVSLLKAREKAAAVRAMVADGISPIEEKRHAKLEAKKAQHLTFGQAADDFLKSKSSEWRNDKHAAQWKMTLTKYAAPLRSMRVDEITTDDIIDVIKPLWDEKPETASRLRGRIEMVLNVARVRGFIAKDAANPARWKGHLELLLPKRSKLSKKHHASLHYEKIPQFMAELRDREGISARALEFTILTAARTGETLGANWGEIDLTKKIWTIPAERMKAGKEHRVPLCNRAIEILKLMKELELDDLIFPGTKYDRGLSNMSMDAVLRRMKVDDATVHGMRSTFRNWIWDETSYQHDLAEAALAHALESKVAAAYRTSDALSKRREMMQAWCDYCFSM
jgi:integrase